MANSMADHRRAHEAPEPIPNALVEAAAEAMSDTAEEMAAPRCPIKWAQVDEGSRKCWRQIARAALEVAQREWRKR